jgi:hypothetical protein
VRIDEPNELDYQLQKNSKEPNGETCFICLQSSATGYFKITLKSPKYKYEFEYAACVDCLESLRFIDPKLLPISIGQMIINFHKEQNK